MKILLNLEKIVFFFKVNLKIINCTQPIYKIKLSLLIYKYNIFNKEMYII